MNQEDLAYFILTLKGLYLHEAKQRVHAEGLRFRVTREDGMDYYGSAEFRKDRVNVEVGQGRIWDVSIG